MITYNSSLTAAISGQSRSAILLATIVTPTGTYYVSDCPVGTADGLDYDYLPVVASFGNVGASRRYRDMLDGGKLSFESGTISLIICQDSQSLMQSLVSCKTDRIDIDIHLWSYGVSDQDKELLWSMCAQEPIKFDEGSMVCRLDVVTRLIKINPHLAPHGAWSVPYVIGTSRYPVNLSDNSPLVARLGVGISDLYTGPIKVEIVRGAIASGDVYINDELVTVQVAGLDVSISARGVNSTTARPHHAKSYMCNAGANYMYDLCVDTGTATVNGVYGDSFDLLPAYTVGSNNNIVTASFGRLPYVGIEEEEADALLLDQVTGSFAGSSSDRIWQAIDGSLTDYTHQEINTSGWWIGINYHTISSGTYHVHIDSNLSISNDDSPACVLDAECPHDFGPGMTLKRGPFLDSGDDSIPICTENGNQCAVISGYCELTTGPVGKVQNFTCQIIMGTHEVKTFVSDGSDAMVWIASVGGVTLNTIDSTDDTVVVDSSAGTTTTLSVADGTDLGQLVLQAHFAPYSEYNTADGNYDAYAEMSVSQVIIDYDKLNNNDRHVGDTVLSRFDRDLSAIGEFVSAAIEITYNVGNIHWTAISDTTSGLQDTVDINIIEHSDNSIDIGDDTSIATETLTKDDGASTKTYQLSASTWEELRQTIVGLHYQLDYQGDYEAIVEAQHSKITWKITYKPAHSQEDYHTLIIPDVVCADVTDKHGSGAFDTYPSAVVKQMLIDHAGAQATDFGSSFTDADNKYESDGYYQINGIIPGNTKLHDALRMVLTDGVGMLSYQTGKYNYLTGYDLDTDRLTNATADVELADVDVIIKSKSLEMSHSDSVVNAIKVTCTPYCGAAQVYKYREIAPGTYGVSEHVVDVPLLYRADTVDKGATADKYAEIMLKLYGTPYITMIADVMIPLGHKIEIGDIVSSPSYLGINGGIVVDVAFLPGSGRNKVVHKYVISMVCRGAITFGGDSGSGAGSGPVY